METRVTRVEVEEVIPAIQMEQTLARAQVTTTPKVLQVVKERIILEGLLRRLAQLPSWRWSIVLPLDEGWVAILKRQPW
jgi:hypothetical protein